MLFLKKADSTSVGDDNVYKITYIDSSNGIMCGPSAMFNSSLCVTGVCTHNFNVSSSLCHSSRSINITAYVNNTDSGETTMFGNLLMYLYFHFVINFLCILSDVDNNFVNISISQTGTELKVKCSFLNQPEANMKSCVVTIRPLSDNSTDCPPSCNSSSEPTTADYLVTKFDGFSFRGEIWFKVSASNDSKTVTVEGKYNCTSGESPLEL